jgi:hypothetical protein
MHVPAVISQSRPVPGQPWRSWPVVRDNYQVRAGIIVVARGSLTHRGVIAREGRLIRIRDRIALLTLATG